VLISKGVRVTVFLTVPGLFSLLVVFQCILGKPQEVMHSYDRDKSSNHNKIYLSTYMFLPIFSQSLDETPSFPTPFRMSAM